MVIAFDECGPLQQAPLPPASVAGTGLAATINASGADVVIAGTPIDLAQDIPLELPIVRARYRYADIATPTLWDAVTDFLRDRGLIA